MEMMIELKVKAAQAIDFYNFLGGDKSLLHQVAKKEKPKDEPKKNVNKKVNKRNY
jgi:hypothetical protein